MDQKACVQLLRRMLEIYSPSGEEGKLASFLVEELGRLGFKKVRTNKVGNVYGEIGSGSPTVLLCGHMDTVPGRTMVKTENNRLHGRGAVDAKSSLAAMISAASSLKPDAMKGRVIVAGVVEEEAKAKGIKRLMSEGLRVDYAVFGEPSGVKNITFAYKGKIGLDVTLKTVSGHVGAQHLLKNAIEKAFELWTNLKNS
ncbi:MAG: M20/M25/M40 family metallo-hydrolase, partial [Candidatus Bathyarchaeota archaeon]|nr:M20/M25/M40 family metallo-hydrolase [Candidatus Bathyarchaeota archaeon]